MLSLTLKNVFNSTYYYLSYLGFDTGRAYDYIGVDIMSMLSYVKIRKSCKIELTQVICYSKDKEGNYYSHALPDPPKVYMCFKERRIKRNRRVLYESY